MALGSPAVKCAKVCSFRVPYIIRFIYWFILHSDSDDKHVSFICVWLLIYNSSVMVSQEWCAKE